MTKRILAALLLSLGFAHAQENLMRVADPKTHSSIEVTALYNKLPSHGYLPVRVRTANHLKVDLKCRLSFQYSAGYGYSGGSRQIESSFELTAAADKAETFDLMVPLLPSSENYNSLKVNLSSAIGIADGSMQSSYADNQPAVMMSSGLFQANASKLDPAVKSHYSGGGYGGSSTTFAGSFEALDLPDDWRGYSGVDSILMTDRDWSQVSPSARNAIIAWIRLGGYLRVVAIDSAPTVAALGLPEDASFGAIEIGKTNAALELNESQVFERIGKAPLVPSARTAMLNDYESSWPLQNSFGKRTFQYGIFIIVLLAFGILVGPINLFVFAKSGRRHKLFFTTPIISLGASALLIGLIIIQDGFGGSGVRAVLMEVRPDRGENAAYIHQEQFSRTGVVTRASFTTDPSLNLQPVPIADSRWARFTKSHSSAGYQVNSEDTKLDCSGDWFQSRSEQGHVVSAVVPTRGRLELSGTAEAPKIQSTFEFPLQSVVYLDAKQRWWRADNVASGTTVALTAVDASMVQPALAKEYACFAEANSKRLRAAAKRPGHFVAVTDQAPGVPTLDAVKWKSTHTVITGPLTTL